MLYKHFEILVYIWLLRIQKTSKHTKEDKNCCFVCLCSSSDDCLAEYAHWKVFRCFLTFCKFPKIRLAQNGKEKKSGHQPRKTQHPPLPLQQQAASPAASTDDAGRGLPMMPALPIDLPQIFLLCTSQIHARRHLLPPAAAPSAAGAWKRACLLHRAAAWPR